MTPGPGSPSVRSDHVAVEADLTELISAGLEGLATPANLRYGTAICERGGVDLIEIDAYYAIAWVGGLDGTVAAGGGQRRQTRINATEVGLTWHCAGDPRITTSSASAASLSRWP